MPKSRQTASFAVTSPLLRAGACDRLRLLLNTTLVLLALATGASQAEPAALANYSPAASHNQLELEPALAQHMRLAAEKGMLYRILPESSEIGFVIDSPIGPVQANFKNFQGDFTLESGPTRVEGKAMLSAKTDSVQLTSGFVRALLMSETFLDTEQYPEMQFVSQDFFWVNNREAVLLGDLTLHGVTQRIGLHVQLLSAEPGDLQHGPRILIEASAQIQRTAFGMYSLTPFVSDKVNLYMKIHAVQYRAEPVDRLSTVPVPGTTQLAKPGLGIRAAIPKS
jgi:polyisoprenoid-binding protein YceI